MTPTTKSTKIATINDPETIFEIKGSVFISSALSRSYSSSPSGIPSCWRRLLDIIILLLSPSFRSFILAYCWLKQVVRKFIGGADEKAIVKVTDKESMRVNVDFIEADLVDEWFFFTLFSICDAFQKREFYGCISLILSTTLTSGYFCVQHFVRIIHVC